jgi:hypothetical protein
LSLRQFGEQVVVAAVAALPWIVVLGVAAAPIWYIGKKLRS